MKTKTAKTKTPSEFKILEEIREQVIENPKSLDMNHWHGCGTSHCVAGWAQFLYGDMEEDSQEEGERLIPCARPIFFASNKMARAWLETRAWIKENLSAFRAAMRKYGIQVATGNEVIEELSGGEGRAYNGGTIQTVTGGEGWAYNGGTIQTVTGGVGWAYNGGTIVSDETKVAK